MPLPRLLIVSNTYLAPENRKKLHALRSHFEVTCAGPAAAGGMHGRVTDGAQPEDDGIRMVFLRSLGRAESSTRNLLLGLGGVLRKGRFDAVVVESEPWGFLRWQTWLLKKLFQRRAVFGEYSWENFERPGWKGRILTRIYRAANATADFTIAGNEGGAEIFRRLGRTTERLLCCPQMGLDPAVFRRFGEGERQKLREAAGIRPGRFVIGYAGRLTEFKGVADLLAAAERLRARLGDCLELHFLGGGDLRESLVARSLGEPWIRVHAPVPHAEVAGFLNLLDLFAHASKPSRDAKGRLLFIEQTPYALAQAMSCGVPSIGGDVGAIPGMIAVSGMLVPPGDVDALERLIGELMKDGARLAGVGAEQQAWVAGNFTNRVIGDRWAEFIKRQIEARQGGARPVQGE